MCVHPQTVVCTCVYPLSVFNISQNRDVGCVLKDWEDAGIISKLGGTETDRADATE